MTAATRKVRLASSDNRSRRASSTPCKVSGMPMVLISAPAAQPPFWRRIAPRSTIIRNTSSTKQGLPSAFLRNETLQAFGQGFDLQQVGDQLPAVGFGQVIQGPFAETPA